jgi:hypothetical protein
MWAKATTLVALYHRPAMDDVLRGRRGLSDDERAILGDRAALFPLLA